MFSTLTTLLIVFSMVLGGAGVTAYASQDSLPDEGLYVFKMLSEELRLRLGDSAEEHLQLALAYAYRRVGEAAALVDKGLPAHERLLERYQAHMEHAFRIAAGMDDADLLQAMQRIRENLRLQERLMDRVQDGVGGDQDPVMGRLRQQLQERLQLMDECQGDPQLFRHMYQHRETLQTGAGPQNVPDTQPQHQNAPGPQAGAGEGEGSGQQFGPGPQAGPGEGDGSGEQVGPGPSAGPGDGECDGCGDQGGPGPGAGPGDGDCTGDQEGPGPEAGPGPAADPSGDQSGSGQQSGGGPGAGGKGGR